MDARIMAADAPEIRQNVTRKTLGNFTKSKTKFFLSGESSLSEGHQALDLELHNERHVLIETDDAENFLAALSKK